MKLRDGVVAIAAVGLALTACTSASDSASEVEASSPPADVTGALKVWLMDASQPQSVIDAVNEEFEELYPNVTVDVETQQWQGIQDKLNGALDTDETPDVVEVSNNLTARYAGEDLLADLSAYAGDLEIDGMLPGLSAAGELDGIRYGIPYYGGLPVVVYNKSQFEDAGVEVPTSLDELEAAAATLQEENADNSDYSAFHFPGKYWQGALPFVWANDGEIAVQDGEKWAGALDSAASIAGLTQLKGLVDDYSKAPVDGEVNKNVEAFRTGDVGMMIDSWWVPGALNNGDLAGDVGAFALPGIAEETTSPAYFYGSDLAVSAKSDQQALAVEWIKILAGLEAQTLLASEGVIPNQEGAFAGHKGNEFLEVADTAALNSRFTPVSPNWVNVEVSQVLPDMLVSIFSGDATVEQAAADASARITSLLNG